jgi:hypothetical protein
MEKVTLIIECEVLPFSDANRVKDNIRLALEEGNTVVNNVLTVVIRKG